MTSLLFIYNAKSDGISKAFDFAHKIISPKTYNCDLCSLTHGNFGEKKEWTAFIKTSGVNMEFYHKDEFEKQFKTTFSYPTVLVNHNNELKEIITSNELAVFNTTEELINSINTKL